MNNRQLAALETRKKLVETAKKIISDKGLTNVSVEDITDACGVSKGTFYTYFKRKEDIVFELSKGIFDEILVNAKSGSKTMLERLKEYMVNFSTYIEKSSLKLAQEWIKNVVDPDISKEGIWKMEKDISALRELLEFGKGNAMLSAEAPTEKLAYTINDILYGQMLCWAMSGGAYSFSSRTEEFADMYLNAIIGKYLL